MKPFSVPSITNVGTLEGDVLHKIQLSITKSFEPYQRYHFFPRSFKRFVAPNILYEMFLIENARIKFIYNL